MKNYFVLGDNFFENNPLEGFDLNKFNSGAFIFTKIVDNPEEFGVAQMDQDKCNINRRKTRNAKIK